MTDSIRPTKEEVELAMMVARPGADIGPNVACVLAAEVRALRVELAASERRPSRSRMRWMDDEIRRLQARLEAAESIVDDLPDQALSDRLYAALRGES
jgi:hypothetical protein